MRSALHWAQGHWKAIAGLLLIGVAAVALFRNIVLVNVQDAFVNAHLSPVRSPVAGAIADPLPPVGTRIPSERTAEVRNARPDDTLLIETRERLATVQAGLMEARARIEELRAARAEFTQWAERFRTTRDAFLIERQNELRARIGARREQRGDAADTLARLESHSRFVPARQISAARAQAAIAREELEAAEAEWRQLKRERSALAQRIQVADTFSERTFSDQKVQETGLQIRLLEAEISSLQLQEAALKEATASARQQIERESAATIDLPDAVVWQREPAGAHVARFGRIGSVALCKDAVVTATLDRHAFARLKVGDKARISLEQAGDGTVHIDAQIITLTGAAMENILGMAIPFGRATLEDAYGVVLRVAEPDALECAIGRTVQLRFRAS